MSFCLLPPRVFVTTLTLNADFISPQLSVDTPRNSTQAGPGAAKEGLLDMG
jgi:hypothetical protein